MSDPEPVDEQYTEIRGGNRPDDYVPKISGMFGHHEDDDSYDEDDEDDE